MTSGPLPLSLPSPSVCLLPSFIPSMVDLCAWQAGRPAVLTLVPLTRSLWPSAVSTQLKTPPPVPLLFRRPRGSRNYSCVSLCVSGSGQSSQGVPRTHKLVHTTLFQQGGKVIAFADARVAREKVVGSLTTFSKFSTYFELYSTQLWNF